MKKGDKIKVKQFYYTNLSGGTGDSQPIFYGEKFEKPTTLIISKLWDDYETGIRGWAIVDPKDKLLVEYIERNCKPGHNRIYDSGKGYNEKEWIDNSGEFVVYWSEFDIIKE